MSDLPPPEHKTSLELIYPFSSSAAPSRYETLSNKFKEVYGCSPDFFVRAPGRVNLIGEHVDYSGYPVLPFALEQDVVVAVKHNKDDISGKIVLMNVDTSFPRTEFISSEISVDASCHNWTNYFQAAFLGIKEHSKLEAKISLSMLVQGNVPMAAGLSSSSAWVCASSLAISRSYGVVLSKTEMANIARRCERFIGMEGGGMDQAISFLAQAGKAKLIEFNPLTTFDVQLPSDASFVICNSLVEATKYMTAGTNYNKRVVECRLAAAILAKKLGISREQVRKLKDVQTISKASFPEMIKYTHQFLKQTSYTLPEVSAELGIEQDQIKTEYFTKGVQIDTTAFKLYNRALHVFSEAGRVYEFRDTCSSGSGDLLKNLGDLMNASHKSCSEDYECSCPELDELTEICRQGGAVGSRLTGAGWGGCVISLVPSHLVADFQKTVIDKYYSVMQRPKPQNQSDYIFPTQP
eukprot:TRINITY_DN6030_c0_g1_i1.p1 TRINITY_DN6030_c0_g1~~TRINITY_DN6030_c0_g1_i1.p1  ORF type:complete len:465 (-),score=120.94 TRINITY_DN6030_c0_g1_i1:29-1423(-)